MTEEIDRGGSEVRGRIPSARVQTLEYMLSSTPDVYLRVESSLEERAVDSRRPFRTFHLESVEARRHHETAAPSKFELQNTCVP